MVHETRCVPGGQGSMSAETRGCTYCGECICVAKSISWGNCVDFTLLQSNAGELQDMCSNYYY